MKKMLLAIIVITLISCTAKPEESASGGLEEAFANALQLHAPAWIECAIDKDERVGPMAV